MGFFSFFKYSFIIFPAHRFRITDIGFVDDATFKDDAVTCVQLLWPRFYVNREVIVTITLNFRRQYSRLMLIS
jgi:hypothetical protein